jgi:hypothetical protein
MARRSGMYKGEKRKKEVKRQKKQEEKRLRRQKNVQAHPQESEHIEEVPEKTD